MCTYISTCGCKSSSMEFYWRHVENEKRNSMLMVQAIELFIFSRSTNLTCFTWKTCHVGKKTKQLIGLSR